MDSIFVVNKHKRVCIYLFMFLAMSCQFFYLIDDDILPAGDIGLLIGLMFLASIMIYRVKGYYSYAIIAVGAILLAFTSAFQSNQLNGQSIWLGLRPQRQYIFCWLLYFVLSKALYIGKLEKSDIVSIIRAGAYIQLFLYILQFFVGETHMFLDIMVNYRYGSLRLYGSTFFIDLLYIFSLSEMIDHTKLKKRNVFEITIALLYIVLIRKGRMISLCYIAVLMLALLVWKGASYKKILIFAGICTVAGVLLSDEMIEYFLQALNGSQGDVNVVIRESAAAFYLNMLREHPVLGGGYVNTTYAPAARMAGINYEYYFADNGFIGYLYQYGILGGIWNLLLFLKLAFDGIKMVKEERDYAIVLLLIYTLMGIKSGSWISYYFESFRWVIMCAIADSYRYNKIAKISME